jgi:outer membrane usher protein
MRALRLIATAGLASLWSVASHAADTDLDTAAAAAGRPFEELLLQVDLNRQSLDDTVLILKDPDGTLYVSEGELRRWRLRAPGVAPVINNGVAYYPLTAMTPLSTRLDTASQRLILEFAPQSFETTRLEPTGTALRPVRPSLGMFLNYDLNYERDAGVESYAGVLESGIFSRWGVLTNSGLYQHNLTQSGFVRLESTWTTDLPDQMATLRVGDSINQPGAWGRALRFGGIQYGTNFATQPGFVSLPLEAVSGQAVLPSTVDIYVNNALAAQRQVPPGPFAIRDLPVVTGSGEVRVVVRDVLGREQVITQPFYSGVALLRKGLSDYSFEAGAIRNNFGIDSDDYGPGVAVGTYRYGFTEEVTGEAHAEWEPNLTAAGGSLSWLVRPFGIITGTVAGSTSEAGGGTLYGIGFERSTAGLSFRARTQIATEGFRQIGISPLQPVPRQASDASVSTSLGRYGTIGVGYADQRQFDGTRTEVVSVNYNVSLHQYGFINVAFIRTVSEPTGWGASITWTVPLGTRTTASLTRQNSSEGGSSNNFWTARLQQSAPVGEGWGYLLEASDNQNARAGALFQNRIGTYTAEAERLNHETNTRLGTQGGIALLGGSPFLTRRITDSFAVVNVPDIKDVRVYADNQEVGRTDASGQLLVPRLRAYDRNHLSIEQLDLPLDAEVGGLAMDVAPYYRAGVVANFPVKRVRSVTLQLLQEDGSAVPSDAEITLIGTDRVFPVGFNGTAFLSGLAAAQNRLQARWDSRACDFTIELPAKEADPQPDLGTVTCKEVRR